MDNGWTKDEGLAQCLHRAQEVVTPRGSWVDMMMMICRAQCLLQAQWVVTPRGVLGGHDGDDELSSLEDFVQWVKDRGNLPHALSVF